MHKPAWQGVFPAVTTQFTEALALDVYATAGLVDRLIGEGVHGLIMLGTVGENCSLSAEEKRTVLKAAKEAAKGRVPVLSGVAEYTTELASRFAAEAAEIGIDGLMVLPGMVYKSDPRETVAHYKAVAAAGPLPIMIYNNPIAYGVDILPEMFVELASSPTLVSIKESSEDPRRLTDIRNLLRDRYVLFAGVDDVVLESLMLGAVGWVSGLANVFPRESVELFQLAKAGRWAEAREIYAWFMPLLHLDTVPKLVQYIKIGQEVLGMASERVRPPRLVLEGEERRRIIKLYEDALAARPRFAAAA
jgi:1-pyrroline-4-hydroxy-2-carboxylate deaminase